MSLTLHQVKDDAAARAWHALAQAVVPFDHPGREADPLESVLGQLPEGTPAERVWLYLACRDREPVGYGKVKLPMADNRHVANVDVTVRPGARRRGHGREFAARLVELARAEGRRVIGAEVGAPLGGSSPGEAFARALGAVPALENLRRELELTDEVRRSLPGRRAGDPPAGYRLVQWSDRTPDELAEDTAALLGRMLSDAPTGELSWEPERWDVSRLRETEEGSRRRGWSRLVSAAVQVRTGRVVAYTDLAVAARHPAIAHQWDTIVAPEHRGRGLGMLVKLANLRQLLERFPAARRVQTVNAAANRHMVDINDRLGFRPVERVTEWELRL